jgi:hypothetical protein
LEGVPIGLVGSARKQDVEPVIVAAPPLARAGNLAWRLVEGSYSVFDRARAALARYSTGPRSGEPGLGSYSCFTSQCPQNAFLRRGSESRPRRPSPRTMPSATTPPAIADLTSTGTSLCSAETRGRLGLRAGRPAHHQAAEEAHGWVRMCLILLVSSSRIWSVGLGPSRYGCRV